MSDQELVALYFKEQQAVLVGLANETPKIQQLVDAVWKTYVAGGTVFACANGGPAGLIDNLCTDLSHHPFVSEDKNAASQGVRRLKTVNLCLSGGVLTGLSNDLGYENVFAGQLRGEITEKDVIIGFSGSGNSENVLNAFLVAKAAGARTFCISGRGGGRATGIVDINIIIPGTSTFPGQTGGNDNNFHIEDMQCAISHILAGLIKYKVTHA